jgi:hypothetical protein
MLGGTQTQVNEPDSLSYVPNGGGHQQPRSSSNPERSPPTRLFLGPGPFGSTRK